MPDSPVINDSDEFTPMPLPGGVVRREDAEELTPVPFQFSDIRALAARILKRAQEQAEQKLAAARSQIASMEKEAQEKAYNEAFPKGEKEGFAKGEKEGKAAGAAEVKKALESQLETFKQDTQPIGNMLKELVTVIDQHRQAIMAQAEADLLLLAVDMAKRLVGRELTIDNEAIRPIAIETIGLVTDRSNIIVRVNPRDLAVMEDELPDLKAIFPDVGAIKLEPDPTIQRGGLVAATREAEVDMRLATRFAAFEEAILGFSGKDAEAPWSRLDPQEAPVQLAEFERQEEAKKQTAAAAMAAQSASLPLIKPMPEAPPDNETPPETEQPALAEGQPDPAPTAEAGMVDPLGNQAVVEIPEIAAETAEQVEPAVVLEPEAVPPPTPSPQENAPPAQEEHSNLPENPQQ